MEHIIKSIKKLEDLYTEYDYLHIEIYSDGSGALCAWGLGIPSDHDVTLFDFDNPNQIVGLLDKLVEEKEQENK
jgi:hypothetical protein